MRQPGTPDIVPEERPGTDQAQQTALPPRSKDGWPSRPRPPGPIPGQPLPARGL